MSWHKADNNSTAIPGVAAASWQKKSVITQREQGQHLVISLGFLSWTFAFCPWQIIYPGLLVHPNRRLKFQYQYQHPENELGENGKPTPFSPRF